MDRVLKTKEITGTISAALTAIVLCGAALTGGIFSSGADRNITAAIAATATVLIIGGGHSQYSAVENDDKKITRDEGTRSQKHES